MAGQHVSFDFEDRRSVDDERGLDGVAVPVRALDRIDIVEVRNLLEARGRIRLVSVVIRNGRIETGIADQPTGDFVVRHVIDGRSCQDDIRSNPPQSLGHSLS